MFDGESPSIYGKRGGRALIAGSTVNHYPFTRKKLKPAWRFFTSSAERSNLARSSCAKSRKSSKPRVPQGAG